MIFEHICNNKREIEYFFLKKRKKTNSLIESFSSLSTKSLMASVNNFSWKISSDCFSNISPIKSSIVTVSKSSGAEGFS